MTISESTLSQPLENQLRSCELLFWEELHGTSDQTLDSTTLMSAVATVGVGVTLGVVKLFVFAFCCCRVSTGGGLLFALVFLSLFVL